MALHRQTKRARVGPAPASSASSEQLLALRSESYLSQRALEAVLRQIQQDGMPSAISRSSQRRALARFGDEVTPCGPLVQELLLPLPEKHPHRRVGVQAPMPMLWACVRRVAPFRKLMRELLRAHTPSLENKWNIIIYIYGRHFPTGPPR